MKDRRNWLILGWLAALSAAVATLFWVETPVINLGPEPTPTFVPVNLNSESIRSESIRTESLTVTGDPGLVLRADRGNAVRLTQFDVTSFGLVIRESRSFKGKLTHVSEFCLWMLSYCHPERYTGGNAFILEYHPVGIDEWCLLDEVKYRLPREPCSKAGGNYTPSDGLAQ